MLDCFLVGFCNCLRNLVNGNSPLSCAILAFRGEVFHKSAHLVLSLAVNSCFMAEELTGNGFLSMWGRSAMGLDLPAAASLAVLSMSSFLFTLLWPDIHLIPKLRPISLAAILRSLIKYCPAAVFCEERAAMIDWLSVYNGILLPVVSGVFFSNHVARIDIAPTISAS